MVGYETVVQILAVQPATCISTSCVMNTQFGRLTWEICCRFAERSMRYHEGVRFAAGALFDSVHSTPATGPQCDSRWILTMQPLWPGLWPCLPAGRKLTMPWAIDADWHWPDDMYVDCSSIEFGCGTSPYVQLIEASMNGVSRKLYPTLLFVKSDS